MRDTLDMAREAGIDEPESDWMYWKAMERFADLVRADERDHGDELTIAYMSGVHRGKELAVQRQWVGLTDEEVEAIWYDHHDREMGYAMRFARAIEAKLKEKNNG